MKIEENTRRITIEINKEEEARIREALSWLYCYLENTRNTADKMTYETRAKGCELLREIFIK